jgi:hypothetical protein
MDKERGEGEGVYTTTNKVAIQFVELWTLIEKELNSCCNGKRL